MRNRLGERFQVSGYRGCRVVELGWVSTNFDLTFHLSTPSG
jgi:hypothetical protein